MRLGGPQGRSGRVRKNSPPPGFDSRTVQPVASRCTDWAIPGHLGFMVFLEITDSEIGGCHCSASLSVLTALWSNYEEWGRGQLDNVPWEPSSLQICLSSELSRPMNSCRRPHVVVRFVVRSHKNAARFWLLSAYGICHFLILETFWYPKRYKRCLCTCSEHDKTSELEHFLWWEPRYSSGAVATKNNWENRCYRLWSSIILL
jgi:hypothetical protein